MPEQDGHDQRTPCQAQPERLRHRREAERDQPERHAQRDAEEDRHQIGLVQRLRLVAHELRQPGDAFFRAHDLEAVAHLQDQVGVSLQVHAGAQDPGHGDAVLAPDVQFAQALARDGGVRDGEAPGDQLRAGGAPFVHVDRAVLAEEDADLVLVLDVGDDEQFVPLLQGQVQVREEDLVAPHHAGDDDVIDVLSAHQIMDGLAEQGGVLHLAGQPEGVSFVVVFAGGPLLFAAEVHAEECLGQEQHGDGAQHAQRVGDGICRSDPGCGGRHV